MVRVVPVHTNTERPWHGCAGDSIVNCTMQDSEKGPKNLKHLPNVTLNTLSSKHTTKYPTPLETCVALTVPSVHPLVVDVAGSLIQSYEGYIFSAGDLCTNKLLSLNLHCQRAT